MNLRSRAFWLPAVVAVAGYAVALANDSSCSTAREMALWMGLIMGWVGGVFAATAALRSRMTRAGAVALGLVLATVVTFAVAADAGFVQTDYCSPTTGRT